MSVSLIALVAAFGAGVVSFLSPCVLPLIPGYLSYLARPDQTDILDASAARGRVLLHSVWFVAGSVIVLTILGAVAGSLGSALAGYQLTLERIGGALLILFGIALTGLVPIPFLSGELRIQLAPGRSAWWRSGLIGMAFGASWSACSGPVLAGVLVLATLRSQALVQGTLLMLAFALGQGVPFLLTGVLLDRAGAFVRRIHRFTRVLSYIAAAILILTGVSLSLNLFPGA
jgi:cytochrome c-type biogenesis protein